MSCGIYSVHTNRFNALDVTGTFGCGSGQSNPEAVFLPLGWETNGTQDRCGGRRRFSRLRSWHERGCCVRVYVGAVGFTGRWVGAQAEYSASRGLTGAPAAGAPQAAKTTPSISITNQHERQTA